MQEISFFIPNHKLQPKERPRRGRGGHFYTPKKTVESESVVAGYAKIGMKGRDPLIGYIKLVVSLIEPPPSSWSRKKQAAAMLGDHFPSKRDFDNQIKNLQDGMNGICYNDDRQIVALDAVRSYGPSYLIKVTVIEIKNAQELINA